MWKLGISLLKMENKSYFQNDCRWINLVQDLQKNLSGQYRYVNKTMDYVNLFPSAIIDIWIKEECVI